MRGFKAALSGGRRQSEPHAKSTGNLGAPGASYDSGLILQNEASVAPSYSPPRKGTFEDGVQVWHECADATVDVCFVHGLAGNRDSTWTADGQSSPWPKTMLPLRLPKARILTFGYDAYPLQKSAVSSNRLRDHAENLLKDLTNDRRFNRISSHPIIFVTHDLGGIVCTEAILRSRDHLSRSCGMYSTTQGVLRF